MRAPRRLRHAAPALLCGFAALLIGATWWSTLAQLREQEEAALAGAARDAANTATVFQEHSSRTIQSADQAVRFIKYEYAEQGAALDLGALVERGVVLGDIFNLYSVMDATGELVLSSKPFKPGNYLDREHVRVHQGADSGALFLSKPVLGRVSGKWSMQLTRRINRADGGFGGVVVVSMDPFYFTRVYQQIKLGENDTVSLIGDDGIVRARRTGAVVGIGQDVSASPIMAAVKSHASGGLRMRSSIDGRERIYAFRQVGAYPLSVVVGLDVEDLLAPIVAERHVALAKAAGVSAIVMLFTALLLNLFFRLQRSHARALAAFTAKSEFLSHMSHELRTPLHGILGYADLLAEEVDDEAQRGYARTIQASGEHLLALVNTLLRLGRVENAGAELDIARVDPRALLEQVRTTYADSAQRKGLALTLAVDAALPAEIWSDRVKLVQVLNNLLNNAIKFTAHGQVRLRAALAGECLLLEVSDDGPGIAPHWQAAVFEQFVQVDDDATPAHGGAPAAKALAEQGTGLGLAITRQLVELLGGEITLDSPPGAGATFRVALPLLPART